MSDLYEVELKALVERAEVLIEAGQLDEAAFMLHAAEEATRAVIKVHDVIQVDDDYEDAA